LFVLLVGFLGQDDELNKRFPFLLVAQAMEALIKAAGMEIWEQCLRGFDHRHRKVAL
jgi:hypothetical protein